MQAQRLVSAARAQHATLSSVNADDPEGTTCLDTFRTSLFSLSKATNRQSAYQQVAARFPTESQASWEARGAALLSEYADYPAAMQARLSSPQQEDARWLRFGDAYVHVLALLQLDTARGVSEYLWGRDVLQEHVSHAYQTVAEGSQAEDC